MSVRSRSNWNLEVLVFEERGTPEYPQKNLLEQRREPVTTSTDIWWRRRDLNPGHIGGRPVLSPLHQPPLLLLRHLCCVLLRVVAQSLKPVKRFSYVQTDATTPDKVGLTMLYPFARGFSLCLIEHLQWFDKFMGSDVCKFLNVNALRDLKSALDCACGFRLGFLWSHRLGVAIALEATCATLTGRLATKSFRCKMTLIRLVSTSLCSETTL